MVTFSLSSGTKVTISLLSLRTREPMWPTRAEGATSSALGDSALRGAHRAQGGAVVGLGVHRQQHDVLFGLARVV